MAARNYFTRDEITLCTYAAMYQASDFGGESAIEKIAHRSRGSIKMKIQNIAAMLDEAGIPRMNAVAPLTGLPAGKAGRTTNWEIVQPLTKCERKAFLERCRDIVLRHGGPTHHRAGRSADGL